MNKLQQIEFDILKQLDEVCKKNDIRYYLAYGTAIGAVRHKGFIPWDDDVDVVMLRDDYIKFCSLPRETFPYDLFLQTVYSDIEYPFPFAKLRKRATAYVELGMENLNIHHGIFIDIFPLDYIPHNKIGCLKQRMWAEYLWVLMARNRGRKGLKRILISLLNLGCSDKDYIKRIKKAEKKIQCNDGKSATKVALMTYGGRARYAKEYFEVQDFRVTYMEFEGYRFPLMSGYDNFLKVAYGDYMQIPPIEQRIQHKAYLVDFEAEYQPNEMERVKK